MKIEQTPHGQIDELALIWSGEAEALPASFVAGAEARLLFSDHDSVALLAVDRDVVEVAGDGRKHTDLLSAHCARHLPRLVWIVDARGRALRVQIHSFLQELALPSVQIGFDEKILESFERIARRRVSKPEHAIDWLRDQFLIEGGVGTKTRAFATADSEGAKGGFALHGRSARAFVRRSKGTERGEYLLIDKIVRGRSQGGEPIALVIGDLQFVDATAAGRLRAEAAAELDALLASGASFLDLWRKYGEIEKEAIQSRAKQAGSIAYDHVESLPDDRFRFSFHQECRLEDVERFAETLRAEQGLGIEAGEEIPAILSAEQGPGVEAGEAVPENLSGSQRWNRLSPSEQTSAATFQSDIELNRRERSLTLTRDNDREVAPPPRGFLFVSLQGDHTRTKRRQEAQDAIRQARCPMPQLGLLLEGKPVPIPRRGTVPALSASVRRKVFGDRSPTPAQEEALRVALNTPDIALIQGPPGTGKTTVIVALVERLQEVWDTSDGVQGRLLLSGFQHDAVENAITRMSANGLPPIKFGGRRSRGADADKVDRVIEVWSQERAAQIRARLPQHPPCELQKKLTAEIEAYLLAPGTLGQTAAMLERVAGSLGTAVSSALGERMRALARDLSERVRLARQDNPDRERRVRTVRALRCDPLAFADDGPRNAYRVTQTPLPNGSLDPQSLALLREAAAWTSADVPPFLDQLGALRRGLLLELLPVDRTEDSIPRARIDAIEVMRYARDELDRRRRASRDGINEAVLFFLNALESDPEAVKRAVISCTSVFAATCQQSARRELADLKGSSGYDTVVVDEAARATPLDLFIPLARAQRRIVLVGDHRQLPHIIDQKLERELEATLSADSTAEQRTGELLKESLFERLFNDLKQREQTDGVRRTVTLDEQYRMPPTLGDFVSEQFYAPYGEAFRSPRKAQEFAYSLTGYRSPAAWLEVPHKLGGEVPGQSKSRPAEARALVCELKRLMDDPGGGALTFGVITFYSAQVKSIEAELVRAGMAFRDEEEGLAITEPYRDLCRGEGRSIERLRFGTVDAFQGMEFDVVLLSMVRSNTHQDASEKDRRRKFGHLMSPNRLCVAMSRQKRLLIAVGDGAMLDSPGAPEAIGPLVAFRKLCEVHHAERI